jgi:hypothetical protein
VKQGNKAVWLRNGQGTGQGELAGWGLVRGDLAPMRSKRLGAAATRFSAREGRGVTGEGRGGTGGGDTGVRGYKWEERMSVRRESQTEIVCLRYCMSEMRRERVERVIVYCKSCT